MHFGRSNAGGKYTVNGRTLKSIDRQRDLGVPSMDRNGYTPDMAIVC